jgi:hypothetical protein
MLTGASAAAGSRFDALRFANGVPPNEKGPKRPLMNVVVFEMR